MYQTGDKVTIQWAGNDLPAEVLYPVAQRALAGEAQIRVRFEYKGRRFEETLVETTIKADADPRLVAQHANIGKRVTITSGKLAGKTGRIDGVVTNNGVPNYRIRVDGQAGQPTLSEDEFEYKAIKALAVEDDEAGDLPHVHDKVVIVEGDLKGQRGEVIGHTVLHGNPVFNIRLADGSTELLREHEFDVKAITCDDTDYKSTTGRRPYGVKTWRFQAGEHTKAWHGGYRSARSAAKKWARTIGASAIKLMVPEAKSKALFGKPEDVARQQLEKLQPNDLLLLKRIGQAGGVEFQSLSESGRQMAKRLMYDFGLLTISGRGPYEGTYTVTESGKQVLALANKAQGTTKVYTDPKVGDIIDIEDGDYEGEQGRIVKISASGVPMYTVEIRQHDGWYPRTVLREADFTTESNGGRGIRTRPNTF